MKTQLDIDILRIQQLIDFNGKTQRDNFRKQILRGKETNNLAYKMFDLFLKQLNTGGSITIDSNTEKLTNDLFHSKKEIKELEKELEETTRALDNQIKRVEVLDRQIINKNIEVSNLDYKIKLLETKQINETNKKETTSVFDFDDEPLDIPDDYDPYNENIPTDNTPLTMDDYSPFEIESVIGQVGRYKWNTLSTDEKLNKMIELH
tara:strand:+ start:2419 stop:3036 length:618 start_codon:yes stop_codon:yes gene_type:complete